MTSRTTVSVRPETADRLHDLKGRQDTYDDVIRRLIEETGSTDHQAPAQ